MMPGDKLVFYGFMAVGVVVAVCMALFIPVG